MLKEYFKFLKDKPILISILVFFGFEIFLQLGYYQNVQKRNSYSGKIHYLFQHIIKAKLNFEPNILLVGTSLAYEGIDLEELNEKLKPFGFRIQSIAIPGAEMVVQELILKKALENFPNIKYIIHINDVQIPWVEYINPNDAILSMLSIFSAFDSTSNLRKYKFDLGISDYGYLFFKSISLRKDISEFILNPQKRLKEISRAKKNKSNSPFFYKNTYTESLDLYEFNSLEECKKISEFQKPFAKNSNEFHKIAIHKTCSLSLDYQLSFGKTKFTEIFHARLEDFYKIPKSKNIQIINVFAPIPILLSEKINYHKRIHFWVENYSDIALEKIFDLTDSIPVQDNKKYYFDMIHLNKIGMNVFTEKLFQKLISEIGEK